MLELAARMAPSDTVTVEWKHDRTRKTARVTHSQPHRLAHAPRLES